MTFIKKITKNQLFLPLFSMVLVMLVNIIYDVANGNAVFNFFTISINNGILYGRLIDILNRGSEAAILALGMTLVVSASAGTDISVGSVMSLAGGVCCVLLAGFGNVNVNEYAIPLWLGVLAGILVACLCGAFNGFLVAGLKIQPMVATLILFSAGRAIGLLLCNSNIVYVNVESFKFFGGYCWIFPTPILITVLCIAVTALVLKFTALGTYVQAVGSRPPAASTPPTPTTSASTLRWTPSWPWPWAATASAAASSASPAPSSAPTPFRPSPPRSTRWACPPRRRRCSRPSS